MNRIICIKQLRLCISILLIVCSHRAISQYCFSNNGQFANTVNGYPPPYSTDCTFNDNNVINWHRSHGTPQYYKIVSNPSASFMYMWATYDRGLFGRGPVGEGIWGGYNFQANHHYTIKVAAYNQGDNGNLVVVAANGVPTTTMPMSLCQGEDLPNVSGTSIIMNQYLPGFSNSFTEYVITFTPSINYTQAWIYPSTWGDKMEMNVDYISICETACPEYITIYNSGVLTAGETRANFIYAGSTSGTGGSGTVTAKNGVSTSLIAGNEVTLTPNFQVQLTSGEFRAFILSCDPSQQSAREQNQTSRYPSVAAQLDPRGLIPSRGGKRPQQSDSSSFAGTSPFAGSMSIYPNPARDKLKIILSMSTGASYNIEIANSLGIKVKQTQIRATIRYAEIDVGKLPVGIYFIKVNNQFTGKFEKIK